MDILEYYALPQPDKDRWLEKLKESDWAAGQLLYWLLCSGAFRPLCGKTARVYLLTDGTNLVSFCTLAEQDDVRDTDLGPWIGFVYTFPAWRGHRYVGRLLDHAFQTAGAEGAKRVYISTGETGLYEKYGWRFDRLLPSMSGEDSQVYVKEELRGNTTWRS